jgi:hypothetical protein
MLEAVSMEPNLPASGRADKLAPGTPVIGGLRSGLATRRIVIAVNGPAPRQWKIDDERLAN